LPVADREKWNARWRDRGELGAPSAVLATVAELLPRAGRALDAAGGAGRHALWLAARGFTVTLVDVSDVAIDLARRAGVADARVWDLEEQGPPPGPWDLILSFHYLHRPLFAAYAAALAPGGTLVVVQPTKRNLERHPRPPAEFFLDEGELPRLVPGLQVVHYDEGWLEEGRHEARLLARVDPGLSSRR
jgi:SAM-dependent methyltransferase